MRKPGSNEFSETLEEVDFAFIGTPLKNVFYLESELEFLNERGEGADVLVKVDSILKGDFKSDTVFVNQVDVGNCLKMFKLGNTYLIIGFEIKQYKNIPTPMIMPDNDLSPPPPPPPFTFNEGIVTDESPTSEYADFNNDLLKRYTAMTTDQCLSFSSGTKISTEFLDK